jgi:predicted GIY-YIG superfamily endonuclease
MAIDNCKHTFEALATKVFPIYLKELNRAASCTIKDLIDHKCAVNRNPGMGCYVLYDNASGKQKPFYVGISKDIIRRIKQHVRGSTHNSASLAFLIAKREWELNNGKFTLRRNEAMRDKKFSKYFKNAQSKILKSSVKYIQITNPVELHLFETFCAMHLNTSKFNTYRTH